MFSHTTSYDAKPSIKAEQMLNVRESIFSHYFEKSSMSKFEINSLNPEDTYQVVGYAFSMHRFYNEVYRLEVTDLANALI